MSPVALLSLDLHFNVVLLILLKARDKMTRVSIKAAETVSLRDLRTRSLF